MALIGLLSDSHGRADTTRQAVALLIAHGAEVLVHLGDVERTAVLDELVVKSPSGEGLIEAHVVFGNVDFDAADLGRYAAHLGIRVDHPVGRLDLDGRQLVFLHGHDQRALDAAVRSGADWVCFGHSHRKCDARQGKTRLINPGALFRAAEHTVALLDSRSDALRFYSVARA